MSQYRKRARRHRNGSCLQVVFTLLPVGVFMVVALAAVLALLTVLTGCSG